MKVLLTGATGQVGSYLADELSSAAEVFAPGRAELDLLCASDLRNTVRRFRPDWILHAAAYTAVDRAETEREICMAVNAESTRVLAEAARDLDATLVTFSSDYVFNGRAETPYCETDATDPLNVYGESKLLAEQALEESGCRYLNFRTSWVYSVRGSNFVKTMLRLAASRPELNVVADQLGCPSAAPNIARAVASLLRYTKAELEVRRGTYHLAGLGETTWHGFATEVVAKARELRPDMRWTDPAPVPSAAYPTPAQRPANSRLNCSKAADELNLSLPAWTNSTALIVTELLRAM